MLRLTRPAAGYFHALPAWQGTSPYVNVLRGRTGCKLHLHILHFSGSQATSVDRSGRPPPSTLSSGPVWKSTLGTGTFCYFCRKACSAKIAPLPPPIPPSVTPVHFCLPRFESKNQAPGPLREGFDLGDTVRRQGKGAASRELGRCGGMGGYLGAEGGEAGEPDGAGSHTSHHRSAGEVADLTTAFYARTCPRV